MKNVFTLGTGFEILVLFSRQVDMNTIGNSRFEVYVNKRDNIMITFI